MVDMNELMSFEQGYMVVGNSRYGFQDILGSRL